MATETEEHTGSSDEYTYTHDYTTQDKSSNEYSTTAAMTTEHSHAAGNTNNNNNGGGPGAGYQVKHKSSYRYSKAGAQNDSFYNSAQRHRPSRTESGRQGSGRQAQGPGPAAQGSLSGNGPRKQQSLGPHDRDGAQLRRDENNSSFSNDEAQGPHSNQAQCRNRVPFVKKRQDTICNFGPKMA